MSLIFTRGGEVLMTIFYLDDDIEDVILFSDIVRELDQKIACNTATDSTEALRQLQHGPAPDLIFLDFNMPARTGEECLMLIREMDHLKTVPIIIYSTGVNERLKQRLLRKGAAMVIKKHSTTAELKSFFSTTFLTSSAGE
jgi:CheY-like chemotaxis protein